MESFTEILARYQHPINEALFESVSTFGPKTLLRDAIEYAFKNGGKRFRPTIVHIVADSLDRRWDVTDAALAVEYFHTASLIADDLPCMDDDDMRRESPSVHKAYGEATAILATYALIAAGYDRIRLNGQKLNQEHLIPLALENVAFNTGIFGATGGQYCDLFPSELSEAAVLEIIDKKTGTLFEISFVFGWLFGGGDPGLLEWVKRAARHFGRAFQISDDFLDIRQDEGKVNFPGVVGCEKALRLLSEELSAVKVALKKLRLDSPELLSLIALIENRVAQTPTGSFF
ncbi:MAG: polyprenyl synthetase family protein [Chlamydiales bacterium]|nr:polyprenyl synthetase family protein [Chlamydiales bacterium]